MESIRKEILHYAKYMAAARTATYIDKAKDISDRLDAKITELGNEGVDTTDLRLNLEEFDAKIVCVEENYELAKAAVSDEAINSGEVQQYIRNASRMFKELRALEYEIGIGASVSEADESTGDESVDEAEDEPAAYDAVNESVDDLANESDSGTDGGGDGDADTSGNETESRTDDSGAAS